MKKYRLKESHQKYINEVTGLNLKFGEMPLEEWNLAGYNIQALEEVLSRIELKIFDSDFVICSNMLCKHNGNFTDQEKDLCEKALNGELHEDITVYDFIEHHVNCDYSYASFLVDFNEFKQYLKEKK
jgi:hypothetical protein